MSTREKIMDTMYHLIAKKGYDKASIGVICSEIGISKPAVYYYFKSKEEILVALFDEVINDSSYLDKSFPNQAYTKEEYIHQLLNTGPLMIKDLKDAVEFHSVLFEMYVQSKRIPIISEKMKEYSATTQKFFAAILTTGVTVSALPSDFDVARNAEILHTIIQGIETSIILDLPIDCSMVWKETIQRMFLEKQ